MTPICAECDAEVLRADCHRNRYHEYICRGCQARGVRYTWRNRLQYHKKMLTIGFWILLGLTALALLTAWAFHLMFQLPPALLIN